MIQASPRQHDKQGSVGVCQHRASDTRARCGSALLHKLDGVAELLASKFRVLAELLLNTDGCRAKKGGGRDFRQKKQSIVVVSARKKTCDTRRATPFIQHSPQELVVLGKALGAARCARLDLAGAEADDKVGDEGVLRLTGAVRDHDTPAGLLRHFAGLDGLGHGANLVDLEQQRAAVLAVNGLLDAVQTKSG